MSHSGWSHACRCYRFSFSGTFFISDRYQAAHYIVQEVEQYIPLQLKDRTVLFAIVDDAIKNGWRAGIFGVVALLWVALRFFQALVVGINRAWGGKTYNWWKLPLRNLLMIGILASALLLVNSCTAAESELHTATSINSGYPASSR